MKNSRIVLIVILCILVTAMLCGCDGDLESKTFDQLSFAAPNNWESGKVDVQKKDGIVQKIKDYTPSAEDLNYYENITIWHITFDKDEYLSADKQVDSCLDAIYPKNQFKRTKKDYIKVNGKEVMRQSFIYKEKDEDGDEATVRFSVACIPSKYDLYLARFTYFDSSYNDISLRDKDEFFKSLSLK